MNISIISGDIGIGKSSVEHPVHLTCIRNVHNKMIWLLIRTHDEAAFTGARMAKRIIHMRARYYYIRNEQTVFQQRLAHFNVFY